MLKIISGLVQRDCGDIIPDNDGIILFYNCCNKESDAESEKVLRGCRTKFSTESVPSSRKTTENEKMPCFLHGVYDMILQVLIEQSNLWRNLSAL